MTGERSEPVLVFISVRRRRENVGQFHLRLLVENGLPMSKYTHIDTDNSLI